MNRATLSALLSSHAVSYQMTGSRYICNPPPMDTDEDYIVLMCNPPVGDTLSALVESGFQMNTDPELYNGCPDFYAFRNGQFNVICVDEPAMYQRWVDATEQAKVLNLLAKHDRIALFQKVLYGIDVSAELAF